MRAGLVLEDPARFLQHPRLATEEGEPGRETQHHR
jgi:hypothetical protein